MILQEESRVERSGPLVDDVVCHFSCQGHFCLKVQLVFESENGKRWKGLHRHTWTNCRLCMFPTKKINSLSPFFPLPFAFSIFPVVKSNQVIEGEWPCLPDRAIPPPILHRRGCLFIDVLEKHFWVEEKGDNNKHLDSSLYIDPHVSPFTSVSNSSSYCLSVVFYYVFFFITF